MGKILARSLGLLNEDDDPIPAFDFISLANTRNGIGETVQLLDLDVTENGEYEPLPGYAYKKVTVDVEGGGGSTLITKSITANGNYNASADDADGYSSVTVNVPNTYAAGDEGKVVLSGSLVSQTSRSITENGTYDTTTNDQVVVNVDGEPPVLYSTAGNELYAEYSIISADVPYPALNKLAGAANLKKVKCLKSTGYGGTGYPIKESFKGCPLLESVQLLNGISSSGYAEDVILNCPNIREFITGDIGYPNTVGMGSTNSQYYTFRNITAAFNIIIYTEATDLASVPSNIKTGAPWGATNATVIYKNSVTGDVLT